MVLTGSMSDAGPEAATFVPPLAHALGLMVSQLFDQNCAIVDNCAQDNEKRTLAPTKKYHTIAPTSSYDEEVARLLRQSWILHGGHKESGMTLKDRTATDSA